MTFRCLVLPSNETVKHRERSRGQGWEAAEPCLERGPEVPMGLQVKLFSMSMGEVDPEDVG